MNPISALSWLWKALRGHSVTFAALFALGVLGLSITRLIKNALGAAGVPFLGLLIIPIFLFGYLAKKEREWMPEEAERKRWSRRLVFGAFALAILIAFISPNPPPASTAPRDLGPASTQPKHRGPPGK